MRGRSYEAARNGGFSEKYFRKTLKGGNHMLDHFKAENFTDENGYPAGGTVSGNGLSIKWQNGPLGRGLEQQSPNGAFVETVIAAVITRIEFYQSSIFKCRENALALTKLQEALHWLNHRTMERERRQVEGLHQE
jgi:hypothetical protein